MENIWERLLLYIVISYFIIIYNFVIITYLTLNLSKVFSENIYFGDCSSFRGLKIDAGFKYHISVFLSFTEIERISKLNFRKNLLKLVGFLNAFKATLTPTMLIPAGIYLFEVNNGSTIKICEIFSNLIIKTRSHWWMRSHWCLCCQLWIDFTHCYGVFIVDFGQVNVNHLK